MMIPGWNLSPLPSSRRSPAWGCRWSWRTARAQWRNIIGRRAIVDFNHPLAGKTITYSFQGGAHCRDHRGEDPGLIHLYTQREMEVKEEGSTITIFLPPAIIYDRRWLLWRSRVVQETFEVLPGCPDIVLQETFHRPEKKEAGGKEE